MNRQSLEARLHPKENNAGKSHLETYKTEQKLSETSSETEAIVIIYVEGTKGSVEGIKIVVNGNRCNLE